MKKIFFYIIAVTLPVISMEKQSTPSEQIASEIESLNLKSRKELEATENYRIDEKRIITFNNNSDQDTIRLFNMPIWMAAKHLADIKPKESISLESTNFIAQFRLMIPHKGVYGIQMDLSRLNYSALDRPKDSTIVSLDNYKDVQISINNNKANLFEIIGKNSLSPWQYEFRRKKAEKESDGRYYTSEDVFGDLIAEGKLDMVKQAITEGMSVDTYVHGHTAVMHAAIHAQIDILKMLIASKANLNMIGAYKRTALDHIIARLDNHQHDWEKNDEDQQKIQRYETIIELLLQAGAKPNITIRVADIDYDYYGQLNLPTAVESASDLPRVTELFKKYGFDMQTPKIELRR